MEFEEVMVGVTVEVVYEFQLRFSSQFVEGRTVWKYKGKKTLKGSGGGGNVSGRIKVIMRDRQTHKYYWTDMHKRHTNKSYSLPHLLQEQS